MIQRQDILDALTAAGIEHSIVEHPPARTSAEADEFIRGCSGVRTKSLFIVNRKRTARYLLVMDDQKALELRELARLLDESRLSLGSEDRLTAALGVIPGVVSPHAMISPEHRQATLLFDREMLEEQVLTFHPADNRATILIGTRDLLAFLSDLGVAHRVIDITAEAAQNRRI